jgi:glycosyltransferase involved in cell wall biosynthesis
MHLLQVCNVGQIVGGTAACAWTVTRALPDWQHTVLFFSQPTAETRAVFAPVRCEYSQQLTADLWQQLAPDRLLLHNISAARLAPGLPLSDLQYQHSAGTRAPARRTVYCSRWLAERCQASPASVLYQAVPIPPRVPGRECRELRSELVVGRICTPTARKWPEWQIPLYARWAAEFPEIYWEFVGCPHSQQAQLQQACRGRVNFHSASWQARGLLQHWDVLLYHQPALPESFGRVVAEALRAGCVPVVDDLGGFREIVTSTTGFLCRSETEFTAALAELHNPTTRRTYSRAARAQGDELYSLARFQQQLLPLLLGGARI